MTSPKTAVQETETVHDLLKSFARAVARVHFPENDGHGNPNLTRFFLENGRLPFVSDEIRPWRYRGWCIPYLQMSEAHPQVSPRYNYVLRTLEAGKLLDEPLPQIHFVGEFEPSIKAGIKMLTTCVDYVEQKSGSWNGMREFCEWLAFALGVTPEPSKLAEDVQEFLYRNFNLEPLLLHPSDYLGQMLCETQHGKKNGFYPTPICIVEMMTRMVCAGEMRDRRKEKTTDPCVGTGRMLLCASNFSMRLFGQDIDYLCCLITKINLALYAPWFYIPDSFFDGEDLPISVDLIDSANPEPNAEFDPNPLQDERVLILPEPDNSESSLYERLHAEKAKKSSRKKYSTDIDQPSLFDFSQS